MARADGSPADAGSLFVELTGRSTVVEHQRDDVPNRVDDGVESALATYLDDATKADGLADTMDDVGSS